MPKQKSQTLKQTKNSTIRVLNNSPRDKSLTHRALLFAAIAKGTSTIHKPLLAQDNLATLLCLKKLGIKIHLTKNTVQVKGNPDAFYQAKNLALDCQNSGTTIRHLIAMLSGSQGNITLTGDASLKKRPMKRILDPLKKWGAKFENEVAPIIINKSTELTQGSYRRFHQLKVASAQIKSALLLFGLLYKKPIQLRGKLASRNHTENFLRFLSIPYKQNAKGIALNFTGVIPSFETLIPADPSSTIFYLFIFALTQKKHVKLVLPEQYFNITRCYSWSMLKSAGYQIQFQKKSDSLCVELLGTLKFSAGKKTKTNFSLPAKYSSFVIDDIPLLMIWSLFLQKKSTFHNLAELQVKESNRVLEMKKIFSCFGLQEHFLERKKSISIIPLKDKCPENLKLIKKYHSDDHRMVMCFHSLLAIAGIKHTITKKEKEIISVSNPQWVSDCETILSWR